jgi:dihydroxyacetone kinase-like protein
MGGFIGPGLLDADVYGPIYTCAAGVNIFKAVQHADRGAGVVLLVSNHSGDVLNARLAARRAAQAGIPLEMVLCSDDVATAPRSQMLERRGLGGLLFTLKIGGSAAERGDDLRSVASLMRTTNERTASLSVALNSSGETKQDLLEIGTGVHGETGVYSGTLRSADDVVTMVMEKLIKDLQSFPEKRYLIFLNGSGGTSLMELHILFQKAYDLLLQHGIQPAGSVVGSFFTTADTKGFSISLCALTDEMEMVWNEPASAACFHWPYE